MKLFSSNIWTNTLTFIYIENVVRLVLFVIFCDSWKFNFTGGFFIFLFMVTGREVIFIFCTVITDPKTSLHVVIKWMPSSKHRFKLPPFSD